MVFTKGKGLVALTLLHMETIIERLSVIGPTKKVVLMQMRSKSQLVQNSSL